MGCGSLVSKHRGAARTLPRPAGTLVRLQGAWCKSMGCAWLCTPMVLISLCKCRTVHAGGVQAIRCFDRFCAEQSEKSPVKCGFLSLKKKGVLCLAHHCCDPGGPSPCKFAGFPGFGFPWTDASICPHGLLGCLCIWMCVFQQKSDKVCMSLPTHVCLFLTHFGFTYLLTIASSLGTKGLFSCFFPSFSSPCFSLPSGSLQNSRCKAKLWGLPLHSPSFPSPDTQQAQAVLLEGVWGCCLTPHHPHEILKSCPAQRKIKATESSKWVAASSTAPTPKPSV